MTCLCSATEAEIERALAEDGKANFYIPCGCDYHGDHLGCDQRCRWDGCTHKVGKEVSCDHTPDHLKKPKKVKKAKHPMQPIELDEKGVARFKQNAIIDWLEREGKIDLNEIALRFYDKQYHEDHMQLAQLLGYSVSGFGDLSYASKKVVRKADKIVRKLTDEC